MTSVLGCRSDTHSIFFLNIVDRVTAWAFMRYAAAGPTRGGGQGGQ